MSTNVGQAFQPDNSAPRAAVRLESLTYGPRSRRQFLLEAGGGLGAIALTSLLANGLRASTTTSNPLAVQPPHFAARAKSVIWCFLDGGPSHIDLFDPKPELTRLDGQPLPNSFNRPVTAMGRTAYTPLLASRRAFRQHGQSGTWVSDWYPEIARHVDDLAVIRSCYADGLNHVGSVCQMNTGSILGGRPCLGSWAIYGLGSENADLPGFVVLADYPEEPPGGNRNWGTGFMPATYQGTKFREGDSPILYLTKYLTKGTGPFLRNPAASREDASSKMDPSPLSVSERAKLDFIQQLNRRHQHPRPDDDQLAARIAAYELAYRMQAAAPEAVDLRQETEETRRLYGLEQKETERMGRNCLLARRLVERGVRFVQIYSGSGSKWDAHSNVEGNHAKYCRESDRPIAGLLADLKRRGLLESTLVIWGGEFGRTPMSESGNGRDHNPYGFTMWLAGGGVRGGITHGATDALGLYAVENKVHVHDLHATILHLLGLDHESLTFAHNGQQERLTMVSGAVVEAILA
ncbi:MAG TPA: DUF1501 domain-containing protein [Pirellulales bacterium]|nr:DUF1501 domain-containing protein [Pirellulales bacterium]